MEGCLRKATIPYVDTQQALKSSVAPLWDNDDDNDNGNDTLNNDNDNNFFTSKNSTKKGHPDVTNHSSTDKGTQVMIDATVAKQLLTKLLVDPLSYADYDHILPITQAQLDFLVSHIDSVVQPPLLDDASGTRTEVGENLNMEPNLDNDDNDDKSFFDEGHGNYWVERLSIHLLRILRDIGAPFETYGTIMKIVSDAIRDKVFITPTYQSHDNAIKHLAT
jgi:hypothetical protein